MLRVLIMAVLLTLAGALPATGQEWAKKMFKVQTHNFGTVARGAKAEFNFEITNLYEEEVHISSVRSSCGCTTPVITKDTIKTFEQSAIQATFNTRSFLGHRQATITVTFDKPFYAEVQLTVSGFIRGDVVLQPGSVAFGSLDLGQEAMQEVTVNYAGRNDWKILDVTSERDYYEVTLNETQRGGGKVDYVLGVKLLPSAPPGYLSDHLILVTNDQNNPQIPLAIEGRIVSPLTISPASLSLGQVQPGEKVVRQVYLRAKKPFKVTGAKCTDDCFQIEPSSDAKLIQMVPIVFRADQKSGKIAQKIEIETDLGGASAIVTVTAEVATQ